MIGRPSFFAASSNGPKLFERDFLIAKINRGRGAAGDADDLRINLRAEGEAGQRHRNRDARLEDEVRAEQQKEDQQKDHIQHRNDPSQPK